MIHPLLDVGLFKKVTNTRKVADEVGIGAAEG